MTQLYHLEQRDALIYAYNALEIAVAKRYAAARAVREINKELERTKTDLHKIDQVDRLQLQLDIAYEEAIDCEEKEKLATIEVNKCNALAQLAALCIVR